MDVGEEGASVSCVILPLCSPSSADPFGGDLGLDKALLKTVEAKKVFHREFSGRASLSGKPSSSITFVPSSPLLTLSFGSDPYLGFFLHRGNALQCQPAGHRPSLYHRHGVHPHYRPIDGTSQLSSSMVSSRVPSPSLPSVSSSFRMSSSKSRHRHHGRRRKFTSGAHAGHRQPMSSTLVPGCAR